MAKGDGSGDASGGAKSGSGLGPGSRLGSGPSNAPGRLVPVQKRSRERLEKILGCAEALLREKGGDAFRMSELVERSGVPFGSLYQYFPDKSAVIGALAERYNAVGQECVSNELARMRKPADVASVLGRITDGFYNMYQSHPAMKAIWEATQADPALQALDAEDCAQLAAKLAEALAACGAATGDEARIRSGMMIALIGAAVRHALTLDSREARTALDCFKRTLA